MATFRTLGIFYRCDRKIGADILPAFGTGLIYWNGATQTIDLYSIILVLYDGICYSTVAFDILQREREGESAKEGAIGNDVAEMNITSADAPNNLKPIIRSVLSLISDLECRLRRPKNRIRAEQQRNQSTTATKESLESDLKRRTNENNNFQLISDLIHSKKFSKTTIFSLAISFGKERFFSPT